MHPIEGVVDAEGIMGDLSRARMTADLNDLGVLSDDEASLRFRDIAFRELDMLADGSADDRPSSHTLK
ncbi:hypothetical protein [Bifidobacterium sp. SO1]|uniref:hypothetical protein n=1 Tax=Bifidobacterium sp. SO1 TaxID=2809029 RepID=UPI001BDBF675|nr:hypothetical protein [Bifidobacterium sp. SO1]MBT1160936.1 hypothetical protein [Bifidobacterium sp. SO1]